MRILGLIPARGGSKGVPRKNIRPLAGKPLLAWSIEAALASAQLAQVVVSTEDEEIAAAAKQHSAQVPFMRPAELASDAASSLDTVIHAVETLGADQFDAVCLLQPTVPFRAAGAIDAAIERFSASGADSLVSVRPIPHQYNPHWALVPTENEQHLQIATGEAELISRRQELPPAYYRDGSIYLTKTTVLLQQRSLYGASMAYLVNDSAPNINIDTEADWQAAETWIANHGR